MIYIINQKSIPKNYYSYYINSLIKFVDFSLIYLEIYHKEHYFFFFFSQMTINISFQVILKAKNFS